MRRSISGGDVEAVGEEALGLSAGEVESSVLVPGTGHGGLQS